MSIPQALLRDEIPRNEAYIEGRRSASGPEGPRPGGTRITQSFDASTLPFGRELKVERLVEWQMGVF